MRRDLRWVAIGAAFVVVAYATAGLDGALLYAASYMLALALGIDNVLVISLMLMNARIPSGDRSSVLRWSFACALGLRIAVLAGALFAMEWLPMATTSFGAFLVYEAIRSFRTDPFAGREEPKSRGLLASIALVELAFAADALAAIAITDALFLLIASSLLATAAIRSMSRTIVVWAPRLRPLRLAALGLLALAGATLIAGTQLHVSPLTTCLVVTGVLGTGLALSRRGA
ncbi:MAG: hypothetical protein JNL83_07885 [Myxococcales bacterium]|nr:hypothetical protein [Myxococcales bacterium]